MLNWPVCLGERVDLEGEGLSLPFNLRSDLHVWFQTLGSD